MAGSMELSNVTLDRDFTDLAVRGGSMAATYIAAQTALQFMYRNTDNTADTDGANLYRAGLAAIGGYLVDKWSTKQKGAARAALQGVAFGLYGAGFSRLIDYMDLTARITRFATPARYRTAETRTGGALYGGAPQDNGLLISWEPPRPKLVSQRAR